MDREKLEKAKEEHIKKFGQYWTTIFDVSDAFKAGAEWLMQQPLSERLTDKEKENIIADYNEDVADDEYNDGYKSALRNIFSADLFKEK